MAADARSYLYVPGNREDRIHRALASEADAVVIDLEDAVPPTAKPEARTIVHSVLTGLPPDSAWIRIGAAADIDAVMCPALTGIWVPKAEPELLREIDALLLDAELTHDIPPNSTPVVALVETAAGVLRAEEVCQAPRVVRLAIGEADLAGELRLHPDPHRTELHGIRLHVVLASAATGTAAPVGPVETTLTNDTLLTETTKTLLRQGFRARTALHPRQLPTINAIFTPSPEEVAEARALLTHYNDEIAVTPDGRFVDPAILRTAHETIARAGHTASSTEEPAE